MQRDVECSVDGCRRRCLCRGFCNIHYQKLARPKCRVNGCEKSRVVGGFCDPHGSRFRRTGDPMAVRLPAGVPCTVCISADRVSIEAAVLAGRLTFVETAEQFGLNMGHVWTHARHHMSRVPKAPSRRCSVCTNPDVDAIDEALAHVVDGRFRGATSVAEIARRFGLSEDAARHHRSKSHEIRRIGEEAERLVAVREWVA